MSQQGYLPARSAKLEQVLELIRTGNNLAMPICSVAAILEGGYRQKDTVRLTGLSVISHTAPEKAAAYAELREGGYACRPAYAAALWNGRHSEHHLQL